LSRKYRGFLHAAASRNFNSFYNDVIKGFTRFIDKVEDTVRAFLNRNENVSIKLLPLGITEFVMT